MKKLFVFATGILFSASIVCAQDAQPKKAEPVKAKTTQTSKKEKCNLKNCVMMKDGKMVTMKDGNEMPMTEDVTLANGNKVTKDGMMIMKDGKQTKLKNDDCMDMNGVWGKMSKHKEPVKK